MLKVLGDKIIDVFDVRFKGVLILAELGEFALDAIESSHFVMRFLAYRRTSR